MKNYKCNCCGASLHVSSKNKEEYICEYCGTKYYEKDNSIIKIETYQNPVRILCCREVIEDVHIKEFGEEIVSEMAMKNITHNLAKSLAPFIRLEEGYDPYTMNHVITAKIRLVEENYNF